MYKIYELDDNLSEGLPVINNTIDLSEGLLIINDTTDLSEGLPVINDISAKMTCVVDDLCDYLLNQRLMTFVIGYLYGCPLNQCLEDLCGRGPVWPITCDLCSL